MRSLREPKGAVTNKSFQKLFIKHTCMILTAVLLPMAAVAAAVFGYSRKSLIKEVDRVNAHSLENTCATINMIFLETHATLNTFAASEEVREFVKLQKGEFPDYNYIKRARNIYKDALKSRRPYLDTAICVYSAESDFLISSADMGQSYRFYEDKELKLIYSEWKEENPDGSSFLSLRKKGTGEYTCLTFYQAVSGSRDSFVSVDISLDAFTGYLTDNRQLSGGTILLLNEKGLILFDSTGVMTGERWEQASARNGEERGMTAEVGGILQRVSWMPLKQKGLIGVQLIPFAEYRANLKKMQNFLILILAGSTAAALLISYITSRRLFRPVSGILKIVYDPGSFNRNTGQYGEIGQLLMKVLDSFEKNITLEKEMVEKTNNLRKARADALQEQIAPHFLYNALQAVNWIAVSETEKKESLTSRAIVTLAEIVRNCLEPSDNFTTVENEIDYVNKFMEIEKLRYGDSIELHFDLEPKAAGVLIPRISIQPLVENAISHGILPHGCKGRIFAAVFIGSEGLIHITVEDDGTGMTKEQILQIEEQCGTEYIFAGKHIGMINLIQRIKLIYGDAYMPYLGKSNYGGLKVEIAIPVVKKTG